MNKQLRTKIALAATAALVAVAVIALAVLLNFDWNRARPWLNTHTSEALGRPFIISGNLSLTWEKQAGESSGLDEHWRGVIPWPHFVAQDIHVGNPPAMVTTNASAPPDMAYIKQIAFSLNPWALLNKHINIPVLSFDSPLVILLRNANGENNWTFKSDDRSLPWKLTLHSVIFARGSVRLIDAIKHADLTATVDTPGADRNDGVVWQLSGKFNDEVISGNGKAGAILSLQHQTAPYPIMARLRIGQTVIAVEGALTRPTDLTALDMRLQVSGISMARLYALTGIFLPETPPFATEGHLTGVINPHGSHWNYDKFSGRIGSSDIGGHVEYQTQQPRAVVSGTVVSHSLYFSDLAPLIGADSNISKAKRGDATVQPKNKILPVEQFKAERWNSVDANINFSAENIIRKQALPIKKLTANIRLQDGVLSLSPLNFDMAGGKMGSDIKLDGSGKTVRNTIRATMKVTARHLKLKQLFPDLPLMQASSGEINGDAHLSAVGNSVASLLGASNGEIKTLINQSTVSRLLLEEMGLNIGNVILTHLVGDKQVKINCMASDFGVTNGLMQAHSFIIDTDDATLTVSGNINLAREQLNLTINTRSKGMRMFSLRAPLYIRGSFKQPKVSVDKGILAMRAGGALALTVLTPFAALIPLVSTESGADSGCTRLLANARVTPVAPLPGKVYPGKTGSRKTGNRN